MSGGMKFKAETGTHGKYLRRRVPKQPSVAKPKPANWVSVTCNKRLCYSCFSLKCTHGYHGKVGPR